jgi:DNA polymerase-4/DNA polymerase V
VVGFAVDSITLATFPNAILHFDGDAFFTSVEQAVHPELKGRPVVTGKERGIIACASYEAKALGIRRGVQLWEAQKKCPDLVVLPSDYETYSLYSKRMFEIVRRYTPLVEEHSIDEGFADISGLRRCFHCSYRDIAKRIRNDVQAELDITVSVGMSLSKSLAKLASSYRKPRGFTAVAGRHIHLFLQRLALSDVWGFGPNTVSLLRKHGIRSPYDFVLKDEKWAEQLLGKIGREIWNELRGHSVYPVDPEEKTTYASISKCKTFTAPSSQRDYVYAKLVRNVESAFIKLRRYNLRTKKIVVALRWQDFRRAAMEAKLSRATSATQEVLPVVRELFDALYVDGDEYRATLIVLEGLEEDRNAQFELFVDQVHIDNMSAAARIIDAVNEKYGKHALSLGTSLYLGTNRKTARDELPWRKTDLLSGERARQRLNLPRLAINV